MENACSQSCQTIPTWPICRARRRDAVVDATESLVLEYGYDAWGKAPTGFPKVDENIRDRTLAPEYYDDLASKFISIHEYRTGGW